MLASYRALYTDLINRADEEPLEDPAPGRALGGG
jgi:hypothetical protein